jgi:hypothetical protein
MVLHISDTAALAHIRIHGSAAHCCPTQRLHTRTHPNPNGGQALQRKKNKQSTYLISTDEKDLKRELHVCLCVCVPLTLSPSACPSLARSLKSPLCVPSPSPTCLSASVHAPVFVCIHTCACILIGIYISIYLSTAIYKGKKLYLRLYLPPTHSSISLQQYLYLKIYLLIVISESGGGGADSPFACTLGVKIQNLCSQERVTRTWASVSPTSWAPSSRCGIKERTRRNCSRARRCEQSWGWSCTTATSWAQTAPARCRWSCQRRRRVGFVTSCR